MGLAVAAEDNVVETLNDLGLSDDEVRVYKVLLSLGSRPAGIIAQRAGLKRANTYNVLNDLMGRGIVQEFIKNSVKHFTCSQPNALLSILHQREAELQLQKIRLTQMIPQLEKLRNTNSSRPSVRFFQGVEGIKQIFEDMLTVPDQNIYGVTDIAYSMTFVQGEPGTWIEHFIRRRAELNIWWLGIMNRSPETEHALRTRPWCKRKVRLTESVVLPVEINIYGCKVAITSTHSEVIGVLIENQSIADALRNMHQSVWKHLPEFPPLSQDAE